MKEQDIQSVSLLYLMMRPVVKKSLEAEHILLISGDLNEWTTREVRFSMNKCLYSLC